MCFSCSAQDVPREALEPRAIAEAPPVPVKAPRKTLKQIQQGKEEAHRLLMEAVELEQKDCGAVINLVNADQKVQAQRYRRAPATVFCLLVPMEAEVCFLERARSDSLYIRVCGRARVVELYKRAIAILREVGGDKEDVR